jgi:hypothetical protein
MSTGICRFHLKQALAALVASVALWGCGGPLDEAGDQVAFAEQSAVQEALQAPAVADTATVTVAAVATASSQTTTSNVPDRGAVADSQDPIPIKPDDRPTAGNNPTPPAGGGDPAAANGWVPVAHVYLRR